MADWPSIANPDFPLDDELDLPVISTEFETGAVQTRKRFTTSRGIWTLNWAAMTEANYQTLRTFFGSYQGTTFTWDHPVTSTEYTVRFQGDSLKSSCIANGRRKVSVTLKEA